MYTYDTHDMFDMRIIQQIQEQCFFMIVMVILGIFFVKIYLKLNNSVKLIKLFSIYLQESLP